MCIINNKMYLSVLNDLYKKNKDIHAHNTRTKDMFRISLGTQPSSNVSGKVWNALFSKFDLNLSLYKCKNSLKKQILLKYPK